MPACLHACLPATPTRPYLPPSTHLALGPDLHPYSRPAQPAVPLAAQPSPAISAAALSAAPAPQPTLAEPTCARR